MKTTLILLNVVILIVSTQAGFWDMGNAAYRNPCRILLSLPVTKGWHCNSLEGSVGCVRKIGGPFPTCQCNLGQDAEYDVHNDICVGKVGAICTARTTGLFPQKHCSDENAECVPDRKDHTMGTCKCVAGYINVNRACFLDPDYDGVPATPRPITVVPPPARGNFTLPSLKLSTTVSFGEVCHPSKLNRTVCNSHLGTVNCNSKEGVCDCTVASGNHVFDPEIQACAGLVGSYCLARRNVLGYIPCVTGADCEPDSGTFEEGYSFGNCRCLFGYTSNDLGTCDKLDGVNNPSTKRPIVYPSRRTTSTPYPGDGPMEGEDDSSGIMLTINFELILILCSVLPVFVNRYFQ